MKKLLTLLAVVTMASVTIAGGISGQVTEARTGDPIEGAVVVAQGRSGGGRAVTNGRGVYEIEDLEAGDYAVTAMARGYETARYPRPVTVRRGMVEGIDFRLVRSGGGRRGKGFITGVVVDARTREPIEGAIVFAKRERGRGDAEDKAGGRGRGMFKAVTNARGMYRMAVRPGVYAVMAKARGYEAARFPRRVGVRPRQVVEGISFRLRPAQQPRKGAIVGKVYDARTREPIAGAMVVATGERGRDATRTNRRGMYKLVVPAGQYRVVAAARGYGRQSYPRAVPVRAGEVTRGIDFGLRGRRERAELY